MIWHTWRTRTTCHCCWTRKVSQHLNNSRGKSCKLFFHFSRQAGDVWVKGPSLHCVCGHDLGKGFSLLGAFQETVRRSLKMKMQLLKSMLFCSILWLQSYGVTAEFRQRAYRYYYGARFYSAVCIIVKPHTLCTIPFLVSLFVGQGIANILATGLQETAKRQHSLHFILHWRRMILICFLVTDVADIAKQSFPQPPSRSICVHPCGWDRSGCYSFRPRGLQTFLLGKKEPWN